MCKKRNAGASCETKVVWMEMIGEDRQLVGENFEGDDLD